MSTEVALSAAVKKAKEDIQDRFFKLNASFLQMQETSAEQLAMARRQVSREAVSWVNGYIYDR